MGVDFLLQHPHLKTDLKDLRNQLFSSFPTDSHDIHEPLEISGSGNRVPGIGVVIVEVLVPISCS